MEGQFDGIKERLSSHPESDLLRLAGLDQEPRDFLLAALLDFKKQLGQLTSKDRDFYTNNQFILQETSRRCIVSGGNVQQ
jgi:hypothetical protein